MTTKVISLGFLSVGVILLLQVALPITSFLFWQWGQKFSSQILISPNPSQRKEILGVSIQNDGNFPAFVSSLYRETKPNYRDFSLSVPRLKIDNVKVFVDSNELSKGLVHLPGSALPGEKGNVFISGHSALSPIFSFKTAIFGQLADLKKGDKIIIEAGRAKHTYSVQQLKVVDPKDVSVVLPPDNLERYISLMTCVPPGLNFKRLVVLGKMI